VVKGTKYSKGNIVVTRVCSQDVIEIGVIEKIVAREEDLLLVVTMYSCARNRWRFFEALPENKVLMINFNSLEDFKPLFRRGQAECFKFFLHHYIPVKH
jgi:hypothetical protein